MTMGTRAAAWWRRFAAWWRHGTGWTVAVAAAVAYLPLLASSPGLVGADTKTYLYLDPGGLMSQAGVLWDADRALGTVTHQNIGFLWPMGPFYWFFEMLGVPDWVAQRLWIGTLLFAAGLGVRYLLRTLGFDGRGLLIAMLAYELSPYALHYSARISAVLLPWAGLGWMIGLTVRAARTGGWRHPALFALTVATVGSVNATSLMLAGLGPVLWLVHATVVDRSIGPRRALAAAGRIGVLTVGASLWWMAGLALQSGYSLNVLRYTESRGLVAKASTAPEVLRSLGYWFFYGNDKLGAWIEPSVTYTQGGWLIFVGFGLAVLALGSAALVRWRHRSYFVLLVAVGALVAVGFHPPDAPSALGALFERFSRSGPGLAMRSLPRAVPLVALGMAVLLGAGANALARRLPRLGAAAGVLILAGVVLNNPAMWRIDMIEDNLNRPEELPGYWLEAADALDADRGPDGGTRVWEVPGSDFASYRWGNTVDPITPGLIERSYVARELVPFGSPQSASLLGALDRRLQEDTLDPASLAPVARLMSAGDVVHRADLIFERYRTPRPVETAEFLKRSAGLRQAEAFGDPVPNVAGPQQTMIDEAHLARPVDADHPAPVTRFEVADPLPVVRTRPVAGATVLVGGPDGIVTAAGAGVLDLDRPLVYAADMAADPDLADTVLSHPAHIVVTDTNRRQAQRWGMMRENRGHTEQAGEQPMVHDETDSRMDVFDYDAVEAHVGAADDVRTVSEQRGPVAAQASGYGNPISFTNDDRPYNALDGSLETAWSVAAFSEARGERLRLTLAEPAFVEGMRLVQTLGGPEQPTAETERHITEIAVRIDGRHFATVGLDQRSLSLAGQVIPVGRTVSEIEIEIIDTSIGRRISYAAVAPVGFAEVDLGLGPVLEVIRTPRALLDRVGTGLHDHSVSVVLTRERFNPREPVRTDPELQIVRAVPLGAGLEATVSGTARLAATAPSELIDDLVGMGPAAAGLSASSSGRLAGDLPSRASAVLDGDPTTAWMGRFGPQSGQWLELSSPEPFDASRVEIDVVVDDLHSTPTAVQVLVDGADAGNFELNLSPASQGARPDGTKTVSVPLARSGRTVRLVFDRVEERRTRDWYSNGFVALPVSVAEVRIGDTPPLGPPKDIDTGCRDDLVSIDGRSAPVRITGTAADALARRGLRITGCGPVVLGSPESLIVTAPGSVSGFDIDQLVLTGPQPAPAAPDSVGGVDAVRHGDTAYTVDVPARDRDRWLVLGQSHNRGWHAAVDGADLGPPTVIDGFANGWLLPAGEAATVELRWTPQRLVDWALRLSVLAVAAAAAIAWRGRPDRRVPTLARSEPGRPQLRLPWYRDTSVRPSAAAAVVAAAAVTALAGLSLHDWQVLAPAAGAVVLLALLRRRLWWLAPMAAALSLGCSALFVLIQQYRFRYPPDFSWPNRFETVHIVGMAAIVALAADYAVAVVRARALARARTRRPGATAPGA